MRNSKKLRIAVSEKKSPSKRAMSAHLRGHSLLSKWAFVAQYEEPSPRLVYQLSEFQDFFLAFFPLFFHFYSA